MRIVINISKTHARIISALLFILIVGISADYVSSAAPGLAQWHILSEITNDTNGNVRITTASGKINSSFIDGGVGGSQWTTNGSNIYYNTGSVGIGTTSPSSRLHINGTGSLLNVSNSSYSVLFVNGTSGNVGIGTAAPSEKLEVNGNIKATAFLYSSDERLKENIQKIDNSLEKIMKLNGVSFTWKESGEKGIGLTAQNIETVFPDLVKIDKASGIKSVEYGNLVAPLIEAIKEQQKMISDQNKLISDLQNQIDALKIEIKKS